MGKNNIKILSRQTDVSTFYNKASVVLNLSDKRQFVETFGLTALEAMSAGLPVIVPTEGGIAEIVDDSSWKKTDEVGQEIGNRYLEYCSEKGHEPHYADYVIRWNDTLETTEV